MIRAELSQPDQQICAEPQDSKDSIEILTPVIGVEEREQIYSPPITDENPTIDLTEKGESTESLDATPIEQEIPSPIRSPSPVQLENRIPETIKELSPDLLDNEPISYYIQINTLSDRIFKKNLKRGLEFTLLVVGKCLIYSMLLLNHKIGRAETNIRNVTNEPFSKRTNIRIFVRFDD